jgi:NAD(P)-dependent dehydrogenase (short-subunit alcohol dehydrogenase family)
MRRRRSPPPTGTSCSSTAPDELATVAEACTGRALSIAGDVTHCETNQAAVEAARERFARLDAVVANAGATLGRSIDDTTDEDIEPLVSVNLRAVMLSPRRLQPLRETSGSLVVVASKTGLVAQPDSPLHCATKGAAVQLARALPLDWAAEGIRVNALCPGIVDTAMLDSFLDQLPDPERGDSSRLCRRSGGSRARRSARRRRSSWPRRPPRSSPASLCRSTASRRSDARLNAVMNHLLGVGRNRSTTCASRLRPRFIVFRDRDISRSPCGSALVAGDRGNTFHGARQVRRGASFPPLSGAVRCTRRDSARASNVVPVFCHRIAPAQPRGRSAFEAGEPSR